MYRMAIIKSRSLIALAAFGLLFVLIGCSPTAGGPATEMPVGTATVFINNKTAVPLTDAYPPADNNSDPAVPTEQHQDGEGAFMFAQTNFRPDGNRLVAGMGDIPSHPPIDIDLAGVPAWVLALPFEQGMLWAVVLENGQTQAFIVRDGKAESYALTPGKIPAGMPPLLLMQNSRATIVVPDGDFSPLTHPVFINETGDMAYIDTGGNLVIQQKGVPVVLPVNAQPDARILVDKNGRLLLYTDPTAEYGHGIMGDKLEAGSLTLVSTQPEPPITRVIPAPAGYVLEGIAPIWIDLDADGQREIVVTRSNAGAGAQLVLLNEMGDLIATGPAIGQGGRWRHQLSAGPFGPNGEIELVDVLTPHIGGPIEFFQWRDDELAVTAEADGYTSHVIGSRNLDMAVAGQFDGSGRLTLLLPNQARTELGAIQHTSEGSEVAWTLPLSAQLVTNIAASPLADGRLAVGAGLDNSVLRIWQP
jgi:hypothetical protein